MRRKNPFALALAPLLDTAGNVASIGAGGLQGYQSYKEGTLDMTSTLTWLGIGTAVVLGLALIESSSQASAAAVAPLWASNPPGPSVTIGQDSFFLSGVAATFIPGATTVYSLHSGNTTVVIQCTSVDSVGQTIGGTIVASTNPDFPSGGTVTGIPWMVLWGLTAGS
jgi:hypothetical protein